ncbi:PREDICTED: phosphoinositide phospholipase C 8-like isoform X3 [Brassica oleracea var. oleracea]|uniref:phosphoinositide phospholipase C 8-like isoform X3 n=1 Tax=Brassica oleracea var. oleracea TaxID=109376 RepID=UPI0006A72DCB|nr:PREDICTED: phosphoinositide phospholipase C 8-like isoform X3 [Brassica oleracea var. oleracea]
MIRTPLVTTSPRRNVIVIQGDEGSMTSKAVIEGVVDSPANRETRKEPDRPSSGKAVKQDLPKASNTLKEPDRPSSGKAVKQDLPKASNTLKGTDDPSTNIAIIPATNKKTLKVKIYMGTGWDTDFPKLHRGSSPDLFVNLMIHGGKIQKTVHKRSWTPSWGGEFVFPLSSLENDELVVEVYDHTLIFKDKFAGTFRLWVSKLKPGIQVIPLSDEVGKQCRTARLLMRFMFV